MAFTSILCRAASSLVPLATGHRPPATGQRNNHTAVFTAINHSKEIEQIFYPFKLEEEPGIPSVRLTRTPEDEDIEEEVHMPLLVTGKGEADIVRDDGNKRANQSYTPLVVRLKGNHQPTLEFSCSAYLDEIAIESFVVKNPDTSEVEETYMGPEFHNLNESLRKSFYKLLEHRGIKPLTTNLWLEYMINKAQETG